MHISIDGLGYPSLFEAGLPSIDYDHCPSPSVADEIFREARCQVPIAIGQHEPELLTYKLARRIMRDN